MLNKKGIGPVVATSLLIVVAVVSLVGFQSWFNTYSSEMYLDVESQSSDSISASGIEAVVGESLYFKNGFGKNISIFSVSIDGYDCNVSGNKTSGMKDLNISLCINNVTSATPEVVVITDKGIFSEKIYLKSGSSSSYGSTGLCDGLVGGDWVEIPSNSYFNINSNFCVMKYEARNDGTNFPISKEQDQPWNFIHFNDARINCSNLGTGYHLITNREWMVIARNIENNSINWNSSIIGSGVLARGWSITGNTGTALSSNISCLHNPSANTCASSGNNESRRTHYLSNGEIIWDLSGNLLEFVDLNEDGSTVNGEVCSNFGSSFSFYGTDGYDECVWINSYEKINAVDKKLEIGPYGNYSRSERIGIVDEISEVGKIVVRGGYYASNWNAGIYYFSVQNSGPTDVGGGLFGFRCAYTP